MKDIPAFPVAFKWGNELSQYNGMTLRDYFAAKAMQVVKCSDYETTAEFCYKLADAMMKARTDGL